MSRPLALALACAFTLTLATAHAADPRKVAHLALISDPPGFDPAGPTDVTAAAIEEAIFDRLLTYDFLARPPKLVLDATAWLRSVHSYGYRLAGKRNAKLAEQGKLNDKSREIYCGVYQSTVCARAYGSARVERNNGSKRRPSH